MSQFKHDDVEVVEDKTVWRGFFKVRSLQLRHRLFRGGWGKMLSRELFVRGPAVGLLPYDPVNDLILQVEQFRVGALARGEGPWLNELVAGIIDKAESPEEVARREAVEEAGLNIGRVEAIAEYFSSPGGSDEYFYLFCGECDLSEAGGIFGLAGEGEDIRATVLDFASAMQLLDEGKIDNAHSLIALQWLRQHRARLREQWSSEHRSAEANV